MKTKAKCNDYSDYSIRRFIDYATIAPKYDTTSTYLSITVTEILKEAEDGTLNI